MLLRSSILLLLLLPGSAPLVAQAPASTPSGPSAGRTLRAVPTTRVLAIGHLPPGVTPDRLMPFMGREVPGTVQLYLDGKLDQWYSRQDVNGVVFLFNVTRVEEARDLLEQLPLGQAHLLKFDFIPLGPLSPLGLLLDNHGAPGK